VLCWVALFFLGVLWGGVADHGRDRRLLVIMAVAVIGVIIGGILPFASGEIETEIVGAAILLCWGTLLLWGVLRCAAAARARNERLVVLLAAGVGAVMLLQAGSCLWWRFCAPELWERTVDATGGLRQSTGVTCYPASAVMLLHHYGIAAGEGEMAYLANTSLGGTEDFAMVRALSRKGRANGWRAEVEDTDYDACVRRGHPFIAHVDLPDIGLHAVFVKEITPEYVVIIDPISGVPERLLRAEFDDVWNGGLVRLVSEAP
jgi:hypothetical protein